MNLRAAHESSELPSYRALMVVDMKNFSGEKGRDHAGVTQQIPLLLRQSFHRCGSFDLWNAARFHGTTGDGYFLGFKTRYLPLLLNPFLVALQDELEYQNRISTVEQPMRMRVSLTVGPMTDSGRNTISDGSGDARIEAHRMIDDESVRDLLARSNNTTCVAAIVSARVYEDVVISGYSAEDPDLYVPVGVTVKTYSGRAYLRVPKPSGSLLSQGFRRPGENQNVDLAGTGEADNARQGKASYVGISNANGPVGQVITGHGQTIHTGHGMQYNSIPQSDPKPAIDPHENPH
ncbi:hypothetical protein BAY61_21745 [Prauserella marina]|uniref:Uncharacterized protein n=1 Tax=Prauserella marina TaxID=530584 RepID=A0A222VTM3_9PSEU|nr:hypothetical protein [Prauserella marina]ASR37182.1 hypothetical protein BAY61_21745 [Prauserella marina]PWV72494.1 hypothetical protein DES30_11093 [Prauserella marina]SDD78707.1 hypothetical protein SAMN05421630_112145 [Prauserella marina]